MTTEEPNKPSASANPAPRAQWLGLREEAALEADLPIVDAHHHLWDTPHPRYLFDEMAQDIETGHDVRATVFIEAQSMYRRDGPDSLKPVGEVEFANGVAAMSASGVYGSSQMCAAIVGHANLALGSEVEPVLEALAAAGNGRLRGIRHSGAHNREVRTLAPYGLMRESSFKKGFACLLRRGLRFDLWLYHSQLDDAVELMRAFPEAHVVINHMGGRIGIGRYAENAAEVDAQWKSRLKTLATFPNVYVKLSGLGMALAGFRLHEQPLPPGSHELAALWRPRISTAIDIFGPARCMFASNFPVDKASCSYAVLWNAFKSVTRNFNTGERSALFHDTATAFYSI